MKDRRRLLQKTGKDCFRGPVRIGLENKRSWLLEKIFKKDRRGLFLTAREDLFRGKERIPSEYKTDLF